jgi:hypothetical protein
LSIRCDHAVPACLHLADIDSGDEIELAGHSQNIMRTYEISADFVT